MLLTVEKVDVRLRRNLAYEVRSRRDHAIANAAICPNANRTALAGSGTGL